MTLRVATLLALLPMAAFAQGLSFPQNAVMAVSEDDGFSDYALPTGPWANGAVPSVTIEGTLTRQAWRIDAAGLTSLQILAPLRDQLMADGFQIVFACDTEDCGGFDFRFAQEVIRPPAMQVNLGDFRFLSARKGDQATGLLVSRTTDAGFVQVTRIGSTAPATSTDAQPLRAVRVAQPGAGDLATALRDTGRFVLQGLEFATGSAQLGSDTYPVLQDLADYLTARPALRVALVGHTDSSGSLEGNIALSKRRAGSVMERLASDYAVPRAQMEAQGMGYLSPVANNQTPEGRDANRRVEVIVVSTE